MTRPRGLPVEQRWPRLYAKLKRLGHDAAKAVEILLDAKRGDKHALAWCRMARVVFR